MRGIILPVLAIGSLVGFLGILVWEVPKLDLGIIVAITILLAVWDLFARHRNGSR